MTLLQAVVYGVVQGLGEFLPISSSAHLTLLPWAAGWDDPGLAFDVALHVGTLLALVAYFRRDLLALLRGFFAAIADGGIQGKPERRLPFLVLAGSVPGAVIGLLFEHAAEESFRSPLLIAGAMALLGVLLWAADAGSRTDRPLESIGFVDAITIGLAQACAIVPGVSRSGSTITAARVRGLQREAAARFSFLLAAPIVAGAGALKIPKMIKLHAFTPTVLVGIAVSAVTGYIAVGLLMRLVKTRSYLPFAIYRVAFAAAVVSLWLLRRT